MAADFENPSDSDPPETGLQHMLLLMEQEIARLQEELELIRAGDHPQRRALILDRVSRIDERQSALEQLQAAVSDARTH